jgi:hypothetical protein
MKPPTAFFVSLPFRLENLHRPHLSTEHKPYVIEKTVKLEEIDYENFITDLCVDRWYIEESASLCRIDEDGVWHCLFIRQQSRMDGVLVMSEGRNFPKWAAYMPESG